MINRGGDTKRRRDEKPLSHGVSAFSSSRVITLLTDFGTTDYFVAAVKGVILSANASVRIVDITHEIPPQDIEAAAFTLLAAYSSFPPGTVHVAVVDPGVGSSRRGIAIKVHEQFFVGPDNGIFSYVCDGATPEVFHLTNQKFFRPSASTTFHGRDVFAPVAAALASGVKPDELGPSLTDMVRLSPLAPATERNGRIKGRIIHVDRFGNCVINITRAELPDDSIAAGASLRINGRNITTFRKFFAEGASGRSRLFAIWGSAGFLEIAVTNGSAAKLLKAKRGDLVIVER